MEIPRHWRLQKQRYELIGDIWQNGEVSFPPKLVRPSLQEQSNKTASNDTQVEQKSAVVYQASV